MDRFIFLGISLGLFGIAGSGNISFISYITVLGVLVWPECFLTCLLCCLICCMWSGITTLVSSDFAECI